MNTSLPKDPQFNKYYEKHGKYLRLKGLQPKTIEAYARAIRRIGNYFEARIDHLTSDQLLDYFNDLLQSHSWSAVKLDLYGLKFFYTNVLKRTWEDIPLVKPPKGTRIPDILTIEQANQLFDATNKLSYKVFFFTIYSMGLRLGEGLKNAHLVDSPLDRGGIQTAMKAVVQQIGIKKKTHAIRCATVMQRICWRPGLILLNYKRSLAMSVC